MRRLIAVVVLALLAGQVEAAGRRGGGCSGGSCGQLYGQPQFAQQVQYAQQPQQAQPQVVYQQAPPVQYAAPQQAHVQQGCVGGHRSGRRR